jgi:hypothetical protein
MSGVPRGSIRFNVLLQILAVGVVLLAVNYFSFNNYSRADFSRSQRFVLAEQTKRVLRDLKGPVRISVFFSQTSTSPEAVLYPDVQNLLKELIFSGRKRIEVEQVDPTRNLSRARELQGKYKFNADENVLILEYEGRTKFVSVGELGEFDLTPVMTGEAPKLLSFRGEQVLTNALIALLNPEKKKIYFLQGHGEPGITGSTPISMFVDYAGRQNAEVAPLSLSSLDAIPADAGMVAIIAPQNDLDERETAILARYWTASQGRLLVLLDPNINTPHLRSILESAGIVPMNNRVLRLVRLPFAMAILREVTGEFLPKNPVTKRLTAAGMMFPGQTQSLMADEEVAKKANIQLWPLIVAAEEFWGETDYITDETKGVRYDEGHDVGQPVYVAVAAARGGVNDDRVEVESSKMVAVGNCEFAWDGSISKQGQSLDFLLSSTNWLLDRKELTGGIPKNAQQFTLNLTEKQIRSLALYIMIIMPGAVAVLGLVAWLRRRS